MVQPIDDLTGQPGVLSVLASIEASLDALGDPQLWRLSDGQAVDAVDRAYRLVNRVHGLAVQTVAEADRRDVAGAAGARSTQAWVQARLRMRPGHAKRDTDLARLLLRAATGRHYDDPGIGDPGAGGPGRVVPVEGVRLRSALACGDVSVEQAGSIVTGLGELPRDTTTSARVDAEALLVEQAAVLDPGELSRVGHRVVELLDPDAADRQIAGRLEAEEREARRLRSGTRYVDGHGSVFYRFRLPVSADAAVLPVLDALAAPAPAADGVRDTRTASQRFADGFVEAARRVSLAGGLPAKGGDRPRVVVTMDLHKLRAGIGCGTIVGTGQDLAPSTVRRLACDAQVVPAVLGRAGQLLDLGRAARTFDGPIRTAVIIRDGGCVMPGCHAPPAWCDVHHVKPWWDGGATSLDNGVLACGLHHRAFDTGTWTVTIATDGIPEVTPPAWISSHRTPIRHSRFLQPKPRAPD